MSTATPFQVEDVCQTRPDISSTLGVEYVLGVGLDAGFGRFKPDSWSDDCFTQGVGRHPADDVGRGTTARPRWERQSSAYDSHVASLEVTLRGHERPGRVHGERKYSAQRRRPRAPSWASTRSLADYQANRRPARKPRRTPRGSRALDGAALALPFVTGPSLTCPVRAAAVLERGRHPPDRQDWWPYASDTVARIGDYSKSC